MSRTNIDFDDVILRIHQAPLEPQGWRSVIQDVMELCEAERALMFTVGLMPEKMLERAINFDTASLADYAEHWASEDLLYIGAVQKGRIRPALVSTHEQLVDGRQYLSSAYFNEFLKPNDIEAQLNVCLAAALPEFGVGPSAITLYRGVGREPFSQDHASILQRLAPHLATAARTTGHLEAQSLREPLHRRALDEIRIPLFALDSAGKVALVNREGERLAGAKRWVTLKQNSLGPSSSLVELEAYRQALGKLRSGSGRTLLLTDAASQKQAVMTTVPLGDSAPISVAGRKMAGFVWIVPCTPDTSPVNSLAKLFGLSTAESRLLKKLVDGDSLAHAAEQLHVSLHTARTQLKVIFCKTGRHTQGQLLTLANRMAMIRGDE